MQVCSGVCIFTFWLKLSFCHMTNTKRILLIDEPYPLLVQQLQQAGLSLLFRYHHTREEVLADVPGCTGVIVRSRLQIDQAFLAQAPDLTFVARIGVGTEHIDLEACAAQGVAVYTSPEGSRDTVGEHALGMLLMLLNRLAVADREVRHGQWIREANRGVEIKGKTVGIIGYGNMGTAFAKRLSGFEAEVIAYDKFKTGYGDAYARAVSLEELQAQSDIISLHIPYLPGNHHFVNRDFIQACAKNIYLVNTARGTVLHTADLVEAMQGGKVLGAALDVLEYEEMSFSTLDPATLPKPFQYLRRSERTVLTPHIAGWSHEAKRGHAAVLAEKILKHLDAKAYNKV